MGQQIAVTQVGWDPYVPSSGQITITVQTQQQPTTAQVTLDFPDTGYRVSDWGQVTQLGETFTAVAMVEQYTGSSLQILVEIAHEYDVGNLAPGTYTFTFTSHGQPAASKPFTVHDTQAPTANLPAIPLITSSGGTSLTFTVVYADDVAVQGSTLDSSNVLVTGPNGYNQLAAFDHAVITTNGTPAVATYEITPPRGSWNAVDNGTYTVAMEPNQVTDTSGNPVPAGPLGTFDVSIPVPGNLGVFSGGYWYLDTNGDNQWTSADGGPFAFGSAGVTPVTGDWDGSGKTELGYYNSATSTWFLQTSTGVQQFTFGFTGSNVFPVVGDWNGDGKTEVGVYCNGAWFFDYDGSHTWSATNPNDMAYLGWNDGGTNSVIPVPGYWAGDGKTEMGVYCNGVWFLDSTGTNQWDKSYSYWGWYSPSSPLIPVAGNWSGSGKTDQFGVYNQGVWFRDADGTHQWDAANQAAVAYFGWAGAQPVVGNWLTYASASRLASLPASAAVSLLPQAVAAASRVGAAVQSPFAAATSSGSEAAQEQGSPLAPVPSTSDSGSAGTLTSADNAIAADYEYMVPSQATGPVAIDPQAVDRIDLAAAVKTALGPRLRLSI